MERKLAECDAFDGRQIEVINFGVSGYGTGQELITLREQVWKYSPDFVMLAVTTNNDVIDNSRVLKKTDKIPYFVYNDNRLTLDDSFKNSPAFLGAQAWINRFGRWLRDHSRVVQAAVEGHRGLKIQLMSWRAKRSESLPVPPRPGAGAGAKSSGETQAKRDPLVLAEELGTEHLVYLEPVNAVWNDAWRITEGLMLAMRDEVTTHGAKFLVVTLSNGPQVNPNPKLREEFKKSLGVADLFYPDNRIKALCERGQIPVIILAPELQDFAERNKVALHGFGSNLGNGHWNVSGNRVAGELIAKKFCDSGLLK
jgi:hypothetical protein